jgi:hypothetical protein
MHFNEAKNLLTSTQNQCCWKTGISLLNKDDLNVVVINFSPEPYSNFTNVKNVISSVIHNFSKDNTFVMVFTLSGTNNHVVASSIPVRGFNEAIIRNR